MQRDQFKETGKRCRRGNEEKRRREAEGWKEETGAVREKALSWDPPARDFLPLMYPPRPPFLFTAT